jgi:hypothetical protein
MSVPTSLKALGVVALLFVLVLAVGVMGPPFQVRVNTAETLGRASLVSPDNFYGSGQRIVVQDLRITNTYFIPRVYELSGIKGCFYDSTGKTRGMDASVSYGEFVQTASPFSLGMMASMDRYSGSYAEATPAAIELESGESKNLQLLVSPVNYYQGAQINGYDELLLVKIDRAGSYSYDFCPSVGDEQRKKATIIRLTGIANVSVDSGLVAPAQKTG